MVLDDETIEWVLDLAPRSIAAKQWIERTGSNDEVDFLKFLLAYRTLFPTRKNFD